MQEREGLQLGRTRCEVFDATDCFRLTTQLKHGIPSTDFIRKFRARHQEITSKNTEEKDRSKFRAESFDHVQRFFTMFKDVSKN